MSDSEAAPHRSTFFILAGLVLVWGVFGLLDIKNITYTGYTTDGDNTVIQVAPGSPAEAAGMQAGDYIRSIGGVSVEDTRAQMAQPRPAVGEQRSVVVERGGETVSYDLTYEAEPAGIKLLSYAGSLIGLCFLCFGLWAYLAAPGTGTTRLAVVGLLFGLAWLGGPSLGTSMLAVVVSGMILLAVLLGFAALLDFLKGFPVSAADRKTMGVYGPAVLVGLFPLVFTLLRPDSTSGLNVFFRTLFGLFIFVYFGLSLVILIRTYLRASGKERSAHGLTLMLWGAILGLGPLVVSALVGLISPSTVLPGSQYFFLTLVLIPITFALAAVKSAGSAGLAAASE
jgi:hypothetical protein